MTILPECAHQKTPASLAHAIREVFETLWPISVVIGAVCRFEPRPTLVDPLLERLVRRAPAATLLA